MIIAGNPRAIPASRELTFQKHNERADYGIASASSRAPERAMIKTYTRRIPRKALAP